MVFSFNRLKNLAGNPSFLAETIASVEAPDDKTVVLTLTQPDPSILAKLVFDAFSVVNQSEVEAQGGTAGEDAATADTAEEWLNSNSAGSGPYVLESWEPTVETVLVRNENYWGEAPAIDRVIFRNVAEAATQKIQLEAGDIDIAMDLTADQLPSLRRRRQRLRLPGPQRHLDLPQGQSGSRSGRTDVRSYRAEGRALCT